MTDAQLDALESRLSTVDIDRSTWVPYGERAMLIESREAIAQLRHDLAFLIQARTAR